jgi:hypothetical protein
VTTCGSYATGATACRRTVCGGRTSVTELVQCPSRQVRDMIIRSGMEDGMQDAMDLLEQVAVSLA